MHGHPAHRAAACRIEFKNGDVKIIKNAGAMITHPFGSVMRSLLVAVYELQVQNIFVIGHYDCSMQGLDPSALIQKMIDRKIPQERLDTIRYYGIDIDHWLRGFESVHESILGTVKMIKNHPLMPPDVNVYGFVMDPYTGKIEKLQS